MVPVSSRRSLSEEPENEVVGMGGGGYYKNLWLVLPTFNQYIPWTMAHQNHFGNWSKSSQAILRT